MQRQSLSTTNRIFKLKTIIFLNIFQGLFFNSMDFQKKMHF